MTFAKNKNMQCYAVFMNLHFRTSNTLGIVPCDLGTQSLKSGIPLFQSPSTIRTSKGTFLTYLPDNPTFPSIPLNRLL